MADPNTLSLTEEEQQFFASGGEDVAESLMQETPDTDAGSDPEAQDPQAGDESAADANDAGAEQAAKTEDDAPKAPPQGYVPQAALHEERLARREAAKENEALRVQLARLDERLNILAGLNEKKPDEIEIPALEDDPVGHFQALQKQNAQRVEQLERQIVEQQNYSQHTAEQNRVMAIYKRSADAFIAATPDFAEAYRHLLTSRGHELKALGYPDQQIAQIVADDEYAIAKQAIEQGVNPAERIYLIASNRGYVKPQPAVADPAAEQEQEQAKAKGEEKIVQLAKGQAAAKSLGNAAGGAKSELSLESLAEMNDDDFYKNVQNGTFRKLLGG